MLLNQYSRKDNTWNLIAFLPLRTTATGIMSNLIPEYQRLMYANILRISADSWALDDIIRTTLLRVIDKIDLLKELDHPQLVNYIATACRNSASNQVRFQSRHAANPFEDFIVDADMDYAQNTTENQFFSVKTWLPYQKCGSNWVKRRATFWKSDISLIIRRKKLPQIYISSRPVREWRLLAPESAPWQC